MSSITAPKGTRDIFTPEIGIWNLVENGIREYFSLFLYHEIRTPIFERSELFF